MSVLSRRPEATVNTAASKPIVDAPGSPESILDHLQRDLLAAHRLAMLGTVSGMLAHEFNNLMTPVLAYAQEAGRAQQPAMMKKALDRVVRQTQRAVHIATRLLQLAHQSAIEARSCLLREIVTDALTSLARPLDKDGIELREDIPDGLEVWADRLLLEQLLLNLLLNARAALRPGGYLEIRAEPRGCDRVQIVIADNGVGMPQDVIAQRVNPFLARNAHDELADWQAVGLGLNVCRLIAGAHQASLRADQNGGVGCQVTLDWPKVSPVPPTH